MTLNPFSGSTANRSLTELDCDELIGSDFGYSEPKEGGWTLTASDVLEAENHTESLQARDFVSHSLSHLHTTWDPVGDPAGEIGGCWRHTFQLTAIGLEALYSERRDEYSMADNSLTGSFGADEVVVRGDGDATYFDGPSFDGSDYVAVGARRDADLFGFVDPAELNDQLVESEDGDPVAGPGSSIARRIFEEVDHGYNAARDGGYTVEQMKYEVAKRHAGKELLATAGLGVAGAVIGLVSLPLAVAAGFVGSLWLTLTDDGVDERDVNYDAGFHAGYDFEDETHSFAGHHVVFDVWVSPCANGPVSIESWFGDPERSARWVIDTGTQSTVPCEDAQKDPDAQYRSGIDPSSFLEDLRPVPEPVPGNLEADGYLNTEPDPTPLLEIHEEGDRFAFDATGSTSATRPLERYEFEIRRNTPGGELEASTVTEEPHACFEITEIGNYQVDLRVAESVPDDDPVWSEGSFTDYFAVGEHTAVVSSPEAGSTIHTDETIEFSATGSVFAGTEPPRFEEHDPVRTTWRVYDGEEVIWERTVPALTVEASAIEVFGRADAGEYDVEVDLQGPSRVGDTTRVTVDYEPRLAVSVIVPDNPLAVGERRPVAADVYAASGSLEYDWEYRATPAGTDYTNGPYALGDGQMALYEARYASDVEVTVTVSDDVHEVTASNTFSVVESLDVSLEGPGEYLDPEESFRFEPRVTGVTGVAEYEWEYKISGRGPYPQGTGETHLFFPPGAAEYEMIVTVTDDEGSASASASFVVPDSLSVSLDGPSDPTVGDSHTFDPEVSGATGSLDYEWERAVGETTYQPVTADETFALDLASVGQHTVKVTVSDDYESATGTASFRVGDPALDVSLQAPTDVQAGESHTFVPSVSGGDGDVDLQWERSVGTAPYQPVAADETYTIEFGSARTNSVQVTAFDETDSASDAVSFDIGQQEAIAVTLSEPSDQLEAGETHTFRPSVYGDDDGATYTWTVDGTEVGSGATLDHAFDQPGTYDVALTVEQGTHTDRTETSVTVEEALTDVSAEITSLPSTVTSGDETTARADVSGGEGTIEYTWTLIRPGASRPSDTATGSTYEYPFPSTGTFELRLGVSDVAGQFDEAVAEVTVVEPDVQPTASASVSVDDAARTASLDGTGSSPSADIESYAWTIDQMVSGSSTGSSGWQSVASPSGATADFGGDIGRYRATLEVEADGNTATDQVEFSIKQTSDDDSGGSSGSDGDSDGSDGDSGGSTGDSGGSSDDSSGGSDEPDFCDEGLDSAPIGGGPDWSRCN